MFFEALAGGVVLFLAQGGLLDFQLHDLAFQLVNFRGHGIQFHAQARGGFVHQIHRLVRQKAVGDVTMGKGGGGDQGGVLDADAVVDFVAFLEAAQNGDGFLDAGFVDVNGLETAFQGGVFFDVLAVFVQGGGADAAQFAAGQRRLEHVGGVVGALGRARADDGVQFVNEEQNAPFAGGDFLEKGLEAVLEFAAIFGAGDHRAEIHRDELLVFERFRHVAADDAAGQAFDDGGLARARLADEDGIVLGAAGQHLHDAADFLVAPDDGINFPGAGQGGEVAPVFFQRLKFVLGIGIGHALVAAQFGQGLAGRCRGSGRGLGKFFSGPAALFQQAEQQMFGADVFVVQLGGLGFGGVEGFLQGRAGKQIGRSARRGLLTLRSISRWTAAAKAGRGHAQFLQERRARGFRSGASKRGQQVFRIHFLIGVAPGHFLRLFERFLRLNRQPIHLHEKIIILNGQAANRKLT